MRKIMKKSIIFLGLFLVMFGWVIKSNVQASTPIELYDNVWRLINTKYVDQTNNEQDWGKWRHKYDNVIKSEDDAYVAIDTMVASLNDPYTKFLNPKEFADETGSIKGSLKNGIMELPIKLKEEINKNFENMKKTGANIWNGEVLCVSECNIEEDKIEIICKKSDYAHYLYGERIGCQKEYECKNLSAGCLLETIDGYYIVGELDENTSYPTMLQVTGGGIDQKDIFGENVDVEKTIKREAMEELKINLNDKESILYNRMSYLYVSEDNEQPGVQLFSKAKSKMTVEEMKKYFEEYYEYLKENNLEVEFKKLHFLEKDNAVEELNKLSNPRRNLMF